MNSSPSDTWRYEKFPIFIKIKVARSRSDGHEEARSSSLRGDAWSFRSPSDDGHRNDHDLHRTDGNAIYRDGQISIRWTTTGKRDRAIETTSFLPDLHLTAGKVRERNPRSRCDRTAIAPRSSSDRAPSSRNWCYNPTTRSDCDRLRTRITIDARSWPDRGAIVAQSCCDHASFEAKLKRNSRPIREPRSRPRESPHDASNPLPRPRQLPTIFGLIFPLKSNVFSL